MGALKSTDQDPADQDAEPDYCLECQYPKGHTEHMHQENSSI